MAIDPSTKYAGQIDTSDANFPLGKAQNVSGSGAGDGTPLEQDWVNDVFGFQQYLLTAAGITPSGTPDDAATSQYTDAIVAVVSKALPIRWLGRVVTGGAGPTVTTIYGPTPSPSYVGNEVRLDFTPDLFNAINDATAFIANELNAEVIQPYIGLASRISMTGGGAVNLVQQARTLYVVALGKAP